jgi:hypothetical protein
MVNLDAWGRLLHMKRKDEKRSTLLLEESGKL